MKNLKFTTLFYILFTTTIQAQDSENINLLYQWSVDTLIGSEAFENVYNEVWGVVVDDREYAIIGSTAGTHFFDVTNPSTASEIAFVAGRVVGDEIIHRDYHDYQNYLYAVSDEGLSSLQIIDISTLPDSVSVVYDSSDLFYRSHNIFIDTAKARLYTTNGDIYTLENPIDPKFLYNTSLLSSHDVYVENDTAYINTGTLGFVIVDFSQTTLENQSHEVIGTLPTYPDQGYNHSGWITPDGNYYAMADETWGMRMKMLDISDFSNIEVVALFGSGVDENSIPHNQIINGNYLYTAYYHDGFYVHDISDPFTPILIGYYDTFEPDHHESYMGAWGVYPFLPSGNILISDMQTGLYLFEVNYDNPLGTDVLVNNKNAIYPNPCSDVLNLNLTNKSQVNLYDIQGNKVFNASDVYNIQLNTNFLSNGIYILKLTDETGVSTHKISVQ
jgi:choice-of-anchor B domain-containing protein|tara:strand:+ start:2953 stop:4284 length:1332 start_codon:yes stop_codon:yes gene_type:complete